MTPPSRPSHAALGTLLALMLALTPLFPATAFAEDPPLVGENQGDQAASAEQPSAEIEQPTDEVEQPASTPSFKDPEGPLPSQEGEGQMPSVLGLDSTEPAEAAPLANGESANANYEAAYQAIENAPCVVSWIEVENSLDGTASWLENTWKPGLTEALQGTGVSSDDLTIAVSPETWIAANPYGEEAVYSPGHLEFAVGSNRLPGFFYEKSVTVTPEPEIIPVTEGRAFKVSGGTLGEDYLYPETVGPDEPYRALRVLTNKPLTIQMNAGFSESKSDCIIIENQDAHVTLDAVNINLTDRIGPAVRVNPGQKATFNFIGSTSLTGGYNHAAIEVPTGAQAFFDMSDPAIVNAQGGPGAAGIGGPFGDACGAITFDGSPSAYTVKLVARGGERVLYFPYKYRNETFGGAAIGGGACISEAGIPQPVVSDEKSAIVINRGNISAYGATRAAAIGGGAYHAPWVKIGGGTFPEIIGGMYGAAIGGGNAASGGHIHLFGRAVFSSVQGGRHGAGIGSGTMADTQWVAGERNGGAITIAGHVNLEHVRGGHSASAIGGGLYAGAGEITIQDNSNIVAIAGPAEGMSGGSGIGSGPLGVASIVEGANSEINITGRAIIDAEGAQNGAALGDGVGTGGTIIRTSDSPQITGRGGENASALGSGAFGVEFNTERVFPNSGLIDLQGGTLHLTAGANGATIGAGRTGQSTTTKISNCTLQLYTVGSWLHDSGLAYIGSGAGSNQVNSAPANQSIVINNSSLSIGAASTGNATQYSLAGGDSYEGSIAMLSGTVSGTLQSAWKDKSGAERTNYLFSTQGATTVDGGAFNVDGGEVSLNGVFNSQGQPLYKNIFALEGARGVISFSGGVLEGGTYNFTGASTDKSGTTMVLLPASSVQSGPQTRAVPSNPASEPAAAAFAAAPEAAPTLFAAEAAETAPASEPEPAAAAPAPMAAPAPTVVSVIAEDGTRYQNSYVREEGQTYQKTLYKNGAKVSFDLAGGTGDAPEQNVLPGDTVAEPTNVARSGHTLTGWALEGQPYDFSQRMTESDVGKTFALTATWKAVPTPKPEPDPPTPKPEPTPTPQPLNPTGSETGSDPKATLLRTGDSALPFALAALAGLASAAALVARRKARRD